MIRKLFVFSLLLLINFLAHTQGTTDTVTMADTFRSNGKIYVVVAVCLIILTGLFLYVWKLDRKISKLENSNKPNL